MQEKSVFQENPVFLLSVAFTLGIAAAFEAKIPSCFILLLLPALAVFLLFLSALKRIDVSPAVVLSLLFIAVFFLGIYKGSTQLPDFSRLETLENSSGEVCIELIVLEKLKSTDKWHKIVARPAGTDPYNSSWILFLPMAFEADEVTPGMRIVARVRPFIHKPDLNPSLFDYSRYLIRRGIYITGFVKRKEDITILPSGQAGMLLFSAFRLRIEELIDSSFPEPRHAALQKAVLIGRSDELDNDLMQEFRKSGAVHVLAISGLHVGIIAGVILFFINVVFSRSGKGVRLVFLLTGIWTFAVIAGMQPSVFRAGLMFSIYFLGSIFNRKVKAYQALGLAGLTILIVNPSNLYNLGFQLSFLAVFGIVTFLPFLQSVFPVKNKIIRYIWDGVGIALAAQVATLPVLLYNFREISMVFWLSGILVVPFMSILLPCTLVNLFLVLACKGAPVWSSRIVAGLMDMMIGLNQWISTLNFSFLQSLPFDRVMLVISAFSIISLAIYVKYSSFRFARWGGAGIVCLFLYNYYSLICSRYQKYVIQYADPKNISFQLVDGNRTLDFLSATPGFNLQNALLFNKMKYRISMSENLMNISGDNQALPVKIDRFVWLFTGADLQKIDHNIVFKAVFIHNSLLDSVPQSMAEIKTEDIVLPVNITESAREKWTVFCRENGINILFQQEVGQVTYKY